ncbi:MAG TPA: M20/M25/M40 family metallo-hydrolase [Pseudomonadales bacterium]|nr:M20/M25/M40 family metallo-hydrolase [Pseudomonadales bacterium]
MKRALFCFAVSFAANALAAPLTPDEQAFRDIYKQLVEINTTLSADNCVGATTAMAARLKAAGFTDADVHLIAPPDRPTKSNLVAVLHGTDKSAKGLLLLAHIDVVEAKRADWVRDPFTLIEEDGYFYGRGTADDKAMAAIFVDAMVRYKKANYRPKHDIKMALTCGEETPYDFDGAEYLVEHDKDLIDAALAINEGAGGRLTKAGQRIYNGVQAGEKVYQDYRLEVTNPGGHSSRPVKDNAIYHLAAGLTKLSEFSFPIEFNDATRGYFARMSKIETGQVAADMQAILQTPPNSDALARMLADPTYNSILHTTCVATMLDGGHAPNGLPQRAGANVNCRIFPGTTQESVLKTLEKIVDDPQIKIAFANPPEKVSPAPPLTKAVLAPIEKITQKMWPGVPVVPTMAAGATDGRFLTPNGIPTYGVSGIFADPETTNAHGLNERVKVTSLYEGRTFLDQLIKAYANP